MAEDTGPHPDLFELFPDALVTVDGQGRVVRANRHAEALFGYARGALQGTNVDGLVPLHARQRHRAHRERYMAQPRVRPMGATEQMLRGLRSDGTEFPIEIALSPFSDETGSYSLASIRDISMTAREQQAAARKRYHALEVRIGRLVLESAGAAQLGEHLPALLADALGLDSVAVLLAADQGAHAMDLRWVGATWTPDSVRPLSGPLPDQGMFVEDCAQGGPGGDALPFPLPRKGSMAYLPLLGIGRVEGALLAAASQPGGFGPDARHLLHNAANMLSASLRQRRTEEQLAHAQRLDAIGQLTGGIAHDFNNLLTVMSGSLQLLENECDSEAGHELIASALRSARRGAELTGKLLAFARRQRLLPRNVEVDALLGDTTRLLRHTLGDAIQLLLQVTPRLPAIRVDPAQLEAALLNLALNARDAMPKGGTIRLRAERAPVGARAAGPELPPGDYVRIVVEDDGLGMAPLTLRRATEPFFTTKADGRGSGLGLSMVYGFTRQSGGGLSIDSTPGHGTRVAMYLPTAREQPQVDDPGTRSVRSGGGQTLLVVEDDDEVRKIAEAFLRAGGFRVEVARTGEEALARLAQDAGVDLLFTDLMLGPGMDGHALAVESRRRNPRLLVLLTSGNEAQAELASDFPLLRKPYLRERLLAEVHALLDAHPG